MDQRRVDLLYTDAIPLSGTVSRLAGYDSYRKDAALLATHIEANRTALHDDWVVIL